MTNVPHKHRDMIIAWANGEIIQCRGDDTRPWKDAGVPSWNEGIEYRIKPEGPQYPETKLSGGQLYEIYTEQKDVTACRSLQIVANAVIAQAIKDGQVVPVEHVPGLRMVPLTVVRQVADAVLEAANVAATSRLSRETGKFFIGSVTLSVDCDTIIRHAVKDFA